MIIHKIDEGILFVSRLDLLEWVAADAPDIGYLFTLQKQRDRLLQGERSSDTIRTVNLLDMRIAQICEFMGSSIYDA